MNLRVLLILICFLCSSGISGGLASEDKLTNTQMTFESFLTNPPIIKSAKFEFIKPALSAERISTMKKNNPGISDKMLSQFALDQTNSCWLSLDETNYVLHRPMDGYSGSFGAVEWTLTGSTLKLVDRTINQPSGNWTFQHATSIWLTRRFMNLGIEQMLPHTIAWKQGEDHFTAQCLKNLDGVDTNIGLMEVQLNYSNGVPMGVLAKDEWGRETKIIYQYDSTFFNGELPVEFDVFTIYKDTSISPDKLFSIRFNSIEFTNTPIQADALNPNTMLRGQFSGVTIESNNIDYVMGRKGMQPELTFAQATSAQQIVNDRHHPKRLILARSILVAMLIIPPLLIFRKFFRRK
jgi:hypothetical protein